MKALVIGNRDDADLGVLGEWMDAQGMTVTTVDREDGRLPDLDGFSLVVSMGSVWRVHDPELEPLIRPEQALLRDAVAADVPVLAICFGMQQLTVAFGGEVFGTAEPEIGFRTLAPVDGAEVPTGPGCSSTTTPAGCHPERSSWPATTTGSRPTGWVRPWPCSSTPRWTRPVLQKWSEEGARYLEEAGLSASWLLEQSEANVASSCAVAVELFDRVLGCSLTCRRLPPVGPGAQRSWTMACTSISTIIPGVVSCTPTPVETGSATPEKTSPWARANSPAVEMSAR